MPDKCYTLAGLRDYVAAKYAEEMTQQSKVRRGDQQKEHQRDRILKYNAECHSGDPQDRLFIKSLMSRIMTTGEDGTMPDYPLGYCVNMQTIDQFINWETVDNPYFKFLALLLYHKLKLKEGADAFGAFVTKHHFDRLRTDADGSSGFFIDGKGIDKAWEEENIPLDYSLRFEVLLQLIYEDIRGNSCIDELTYQNVGDISIGVSGIPDTLFSEDTGGYKKAYDTCWVKYQGNPIHLRFLTFGSYSKLKDVVRRGVDYQMKGQFSEKEGYKLGYAKDGSRRSAAIEPFGESPALWIRKFTVKSLSNDALFSGVKGSNLVSTLEKILVQGGATIPICGPQGSGKTTKLEAVCEYIQNFYAIRVMESEFEARLRWKYPNKNIYTVEANENTPVSPAEAYNFSLRTAGDIYIIGEARGDESIVSVTRTANRGGRSVLFTFHPNSPKATITEIANALIREKMYVNLKDAIATALETVHCCIFVRLDIEAQKRYYEIYEFVPRPNGLPNDFLKEMSKEKREAAFMETYYRYMQYMVSADIYYDTVPIIRYDREAGSYVFQNTISDGFYEELMDKTPLHEERMLLERTFRPADALDRIRKATGVGSHITEGWFKSICSAERINTGLLTYADYVAHCLHSDGEG